MKRIALPAFISLLLLLGTVGALLILRREARFGSPDLPPGLPILKVLTLTREPTSEEAERLRALGLRTVGHIAARTRLVTVPRGRPIDLPSDLAALSDAPERASAGLASALKSAPADGSLHVMVRIAPADALSAMADYLGRHAVGPLSVNEPAAILDAHLSVPFIRHLLEDAALPIVSVDPRAELRLLTSDIRSSEASVNLDALPGLNGTGEIIGVADDALGAADGTLHPDIAPALTYGLVPPWAFGDTLGSDVCSHGSHVCGIIGAQGVVNPTARGMAPGARLIFQKMASDPDLRAISYNYAGLYNFIACGATLISCSWGSFDTANSPYYNTECHTLDSVVHDEPTTLLAYAVGNTSGGITTPSFQAHAKNIVSVGSMNHAYTALGSQCSGGTADGRWAPLLVAPGVAVTSLARTADTRTTVNNVTYTGISIQTGTSMATPVVSGTAACLRQFMREQCAVDNPSSALIRAALILLSEPLPQYNPEEAPDAEANLTVGFGALRPAKFLTDDALRFGFEDRIGLTSERRSTAFTVTIPPEAAGTRDLVAVLSWIDVPSETATSATRTDSLLINDYDLSVTCPDGTVISSGDHLNTNERVRVPNAPAGTYTLTVSASHLSAVNETDNIASLSWFAASATGHAFTPTPTADETLALTVEAPDSGERALSLYTLWPAAATTKLPKGSSVKPSVITERKFLALKTVSAVKYLYLASETLTAPVGWTLIYEDGEVRQGKGLTPEFTLDRDATFRWHFTFPGAALKLR